MKKLGKTLVGLGMLTLAGTAAAVPIKGSIAFGTAVNASWTPMAADLVTVVTTATADAVRFNANGNGDDGIVTSGFGDYATTPGEFVDFKDFVFDPLAAGTMLWSFTSGATTYSFTMNQISVGLQGPQFIGMKGTGFASITGFEDTFGQWSLTLNQNGSAFSFSSSAAPEPTVLGLLGLGLLGFGASRRMKKTA